MKVTVTIDPHFQEEGVAITGPKPSERIQKVQQFIEELDQKERLRAKKEGETYLVETHLFHRFYIESRQVVGETKDDHFILTGPLYQLSQDLPIYFLKICAISMYSAFCRTPKFTSSGSVQIYLKNGQMTYSSRRYLKAIKEKLS